jgi:uncharacterized protein (TIGR01777 family)
MRVAVLGATGFVGRHLLPALLADGHRVTAVSRNAERARERVPDGVEVVEWQGLGQAPGFLPANAVINLAGESVVGRWTSARRERLRDSRIAFTESLVATLSGQPPRVLINASAVGYYGSESTDQLLDESTVAGDDFLARLCVDWEDAAMIAAQAGVRLVLPRIGMVLGDGGALEKMLPAFRFGLGGRIGNGQQWTSWIHIDDLVRLLIFALHRDDLQGPLNAVAPHPVRNAEFATCLGSVLNRPAVLPAPGFALRLAFGEMADILLGGQRVIPAALERAGFHFRFPHLRDALADILD